MSEPLIEAVGVDKRYGDGTPVDVLLGLDLTVEAGESIAIVGQSGVGKSTLLHILGALDQPSAGRVSFAGTDIFALDDVAQADFRNREIGFIFQFHHLLPDFTAVENVMMPLLISGMAAAPAEQRAAELLSRVGLAQRVRHRPGELSGGEQQRVAVARAVALAPRAVLADEPTGNLDPATSAAVHELLMDLNREQGISMVIVTHNRDLAGLTDRVLRLENGRLYA